MTPQAAAVLLASERQRITSIIDKRIASWEAFQNDYPTELDVDVIIAELDYIRSRVDERRTEAHPSSNS